MRSRGPGRKGQQQGLGSRDLGVDQEKGGCGGEGVQQTQRVHGHLHGSVPGLRALMGSFNISVVFGDSRLP